MIVRVRTTHPNTFDYVWDCVNYEIVDDELVVMYPERCLTKADCDGSHGHNVKHRYGPGYKWIIEELD